MQTCSQFLSDKLKRTQWTHRLRQKLYLLQGPLRDADPCCSLSYQGVCKQTNASCSVNLEKKCWNVVRLLPRSNPGQLLYSGLGKLYFVVCILAKLETPMRAMKNVSFIGKSGQLCHQFKVGSIRPSTVPRIRKNFFFLLSKRKVCN